MAKSPSRHCGIAGLKAGETEKGETQAKEGRAALKLEIWDIVARPRSSSTSLACQTLFCGYEFGDWGGGTRGKTAMGEYPRT